MRFDRTLFFDNYRSTFGSLDQQEVNGLERLLTCIEADPYVTRLTIAAYILATVKHETAHTFTPIHEYGGKAYFIKRYGGQTAKGRELGNDTPEEGYDYAGKGDTQVTGESNYEKLEIALKKDYPDVIAEFERRTGRKFDLTVGDQPNDKRDPQNMLDPVISYLSMSYGMRTGLFTGKKISDYLNAKETDYDNARRVINGKDKYRTIAAYATKFELILKVSLIKSATVSPAKLVELVSVPEVETPPEGQETANAAASTKEPPPSLIPVPTPVIEVEQISAEKDPDPAPAPKEDIFTRVSNRIIAIPAAILTMLGAVGTWVVSAPLNFTIALVIAAGAIIGVYLIVNAIRNAGKEKRAHDKEVRDLELKKQREQQAFELQKLAMESAMRKDMNTVRIVPPSTAMPNSDNVTTEPVTESQ